MKITLPDNVKTIIGLLETKGFLAFAVGGCIRDCLMDKIPCDWDITTNAKPEEINKILKEDFSVKLYAEKYGTVTAFKNGINYEITTFRSEADYLDHRRPEHIEFVKTLEEDLSRRDFTINSLAYSEKSGLVDIFNGDDDIKNKIIRCVGDPEERFTEDSLRIMRAMRFSSVLGFSIEENTLEAMKQKSSLLKKISAERIRCELAKTLTGENIASTLHECREIIFTLFPSLVCSYGFEQLTPYHNLDVWEHTVKCLEVSPKDLTIRLALLFHDSAKPLCFTKDANGIGHFKGHQLKSAELAREALVDLRFDKKTISAVYTLIARHDEKIFTDKTLITSVNIKNLLHELGSDLFLKLVEIKKADTAAKADFGKENVENNINEIYKKYKKITDNNECYTKSELAINGDDLAILGISGEKVGCILDMCLSKVICEEIPNEKSSLIEFSKGL